MAKLQRGLEFLKKKGKMQKVQIGFAWIWLYGLVTKIYAGFKYRSTRGLARI